MGVGQTREVLGGVGEAWERCGRCLHRGVVEAVDLRTPEADDESGELLLVQREVGRLDRQRAAVLRAREANHLLDLGVPRHRRRVLLLVQQLLRREIVHRAHLQSAGGVHGVSYTRGELWRRACYASQVRTPRTPSDRRRRRAWCGPPTRRGSARATRA